MTATTPFTVASRGSGSGNVERAAHTMLPCLAQGTRLAIDDAVVWRKALRHPRPELKRMHEGVQRFKLFELSKVFKSWA